MIIHNIYIINNEGLCPLSLKLGSIEADPALVSGIFTATQTFWKEITGEAPKLISFQSMNAHIKPFSIKKKNWCLILVTEFEKPELVKKIEDSVLKIVAQNKELFEKFYVETRDINETVGDLIIDELTQILCPHLGRTLFKPVCEIDGKQMDERSCNLISMVICKTKIKDHHNKNSSSSPLKLSSLKEALSQIVKQ